MRESRLSQEEIRKFRALLEKEARVEWFWASIRIWAGWVASVVTATVAVYMGVRQLWH